MKVSAKHLGTVVAVLLLGGLLFVFFRPAPLPVDGAEVRRGPLVVTVDEEGETRVRDRFVVAAPVSGRLQRIGLDEGQEVDAGEVVARMNPLPLDPRVHAEATARLEAAEAERRAAASHVEQARAALEQAKRDAIRARKLAAQRTISAEERERADLAETSRRKELDAALFGAQAADRNVAAARAALLAPGSPEMQPAVQEGLDPVLEIRSPVPGRVLRILEESERVVPVGAPLLEIGDPSKLEIVVDVLSSDAVRIRPGARVLVEEWGGNHALNAQVRYVEPSAFTKLSALGVEEQRVNVIADFIEPPTALGDGYRLEARIVVWETAEAVKVPSSALFRHGPAWNVFVVEDGIARRRSIEVGEGNPLEVQVLHGLDVGEIVILHPGDLIEDGVAVEARMQPGASAGDSS